MAFVKGICQKRIGFQSFPDRNSCPHATDGTDVANRQRVKAAAIGCCDLATVAVASSKGNAATERVGMFDSLHMPTVTGRGAWPPEFRFDSERCWIVHFAHHSAGGVKEALSALATEVEAPKSVKTSKREVPYCPIFQRHSRLPRFHLATEYSIASWMNQPSQMPGSSRQADPSSIHSMR